MSSQRAVVWYECALCYRKAAKSLGMDETPDPAHVGFELCEDEHGTQYFACQDCVQWRDLDLPQWLKRTLKETIRWSDTNSENIAKLREENEKLKEQVRLLEIQKLTDKMSLGVPGANRGDL